MPNPVYVLLILANLYILIPLFLGLFSPLTRDIYIPNNNTPIRLFPSLISARFKVSVAQLAAATWASDGGGSQGDDRSQSSGVRCPLDIHRACLYPFEHGYEHKVLPATAIRHDSGGYWRAWYCSACARPDQLPSLIIMSMRLLCNWKQSGFFGAIKFGPNFCLYERDNWMDITMATSKQWRFIT